MRVFVFVPGILGSALRQRHAPSGQIWPPGSVNAFQSRTYAQLTDSLGPDGVIQTICTQPIYSTITELFAAAGIAPLQAGARPDAALLSYAYDWRLSVEVEADRLANLLDSTTADGDEIVILAHSMGGLLSRYLIETDRYAGRPFGDRLIRFVAINGVLLGAPVMLARALGLEPSQFVVWADTPRLLATPPLSGAYSLAPAPGYGRLFNGPAAIDIFDPYYYTALGLGLQNMRDAQDVWTAILAGAQRANVDYVQITSRLDDASTIERVRYTAGAWTREYGPGDGSVPPWSSQGLANAATPEPLPGEHLGVIHTQAFRGLFAQHVAPLPAGAGGPALLIQPLKSHLRPGGVAEFSVLREGAGPETDGTLVWTAVSDRGAKQGPPVRSDGVGVPDQAAPLVRSRIPDAPGNYDVTLTLGDQSASTRVGVRPADDQGVHAPPPAAAPA
jgi:hypothetical protein